MKCNYLNPTLQHLRWQIKLTNESRNYFRHTEICLNLPTMSIAGYDCTSHFCNKGRLFFVSVAIDLNLTARLYIYRLERGYLTPVSIFLGKLGNSNWFGFFCRRSCMGKLAYWFQFGGSSSKSSENSVEELGECNLLRSHSHLRSNFGHHTA